MKKELIITAALLVSVFCKGQSWKLYSPFNSGLPNSKVNSIAIDTNDVKWIGTSNGLVKYNGASWITYNTSNSPLLSDEVSKLYVNNKSNELWMVLNDLDFDTSIIIGHFNGTAWSFSNLNTLYNLPFVSLISFDFDTNGVVWIGTDQGLLEYNGISWKRYTSSDWGTTDTSYGANFANCKVNPVNNVKHVYTGAYGLTNRYRRFDGSSWTDAFFQPLAGSAANISIIIDGLGGEYTYDAWAGQSLYAFNNNVDTLNCSGFENATLSTSSNFIWKHDLSLGLTSYNTISKIETFYSLDSPYPNIPLLFNPNSFQYYNVGVYLQTPIAISRNGNKWVCFNNGIVEFDELTNTGLSYAPYLNSYQGCEFYTPFNSGLPNCRINNIVSHGGNTWVGTDCGLVKFDGATWTVYDTSNSQIPNAAVHQISIDKKIGDLWMTVGEPNSIANKLVQFTGLTWASYPLPVNGNIKNIAIDTNSNKWLTTTSGNFIKFNNSVFTSYDTLLNGFFVGPCFVDKKTNYVLLQTIAGIGATPAYQYFDGSSLVFLDSAQNNSRAISMDQSGNVYTVESFYSGGGTLGVLSDQNLTKWNPKTGNKVTIDSCSAPALAFVQLRSAIDNNDRLFLSSKLLGGINIRVFDTTSSQFINISNDLINNPYGNLSQEITSDNSNNIWLSSGYGLIKIPNSLTTGSKEINSKPHTVSYLNADPNPFSNSIHISYELPQGEFIRLELYNMAGEMIELLFNKKQQAGNHTYTISNNLPSGIYFIKLSTAQEVQIKQVVKID